MVNKKNISFALSFLAVVTVYVGLISFGYITIYYTAYLAYFGVDIKFIDFWPSLHDFTVIAFPVTVALIVLVCLYIISFFSGNTILRVIAWFANKIGFTRAAKSIKANLVAKEYIYTTTLIALAFLSIMIVFSYATNKGKETAESQEIFTVLRPEDDIKTTDIVLYSNNGQIIVTTYNNDTKEISRDYQLLDSRDKTYEVVRIDR